MKITDILNTRNMSLSFEVFPPKKETSLESVRAATEEIAGYRPSFMSVTYGAGGGTSRYTLEIAKNIKERFGVPTLAHLTCVSSSKETVHEQINALREADIKNIMALRGDLTPELQKTDRSEWNYRYAVELIRELRETGDEFCIGAACYPEIHPESRNQKEDILHLKEKVEADSMAAQFTIRKYQEGISSSIDVQTATVTLLQSKAQLLQCQLSYLYETRMLDYYKGIPLWTESSKRRKD